jgi:hypothetical protein
VSVATRRLYRTTDDRVVFEGDPDAAFLLVNEGEEIPEGYEEPAAQKATQKAEDKAAAKAPNKGTARRSSKG